MSHAYTPGLRVTAHARVRRERRLPLRGEVRVGLGEVVDPDTVVARTELPGNVQTVNVSGRLGVDPARAIGTLQVPVGASVRAGDVLARAGGLFGLVRNSVESPADGVIENVSPVTGQLLLREPPIPVEINAYVSGRVVEVLPHEGVVVETEGAFLQGIFGVGGETHGVLALGVDAPGEELRPGALRAEHRGAVVVGGAWAGFAAIESAREHGVRALVVGGFDDADLRRLLGRDLGVAITGAEDVGLTLVVTEGFGRLAMAARTWRLLAANAGRVASVSGATQIRAGVLRPEILVPGAPGAGSAPSDEREGSLEVGSLVRAIREPHFGRLGRVVELPASLESLETEARVRVLVLEFADGGERAVVPRANVERLAD